MAFVRPLEQSLTFFALWCTDAQTEGQLPTLVTTTAGIYLQTLLEELSLQLGRSFPKQAPGDSRLRLRLRALRLSCT